MTLDDILKSRSDDIDDKTKELQERAKKLRDAIIASKAETNPVENQPGEELSDTSPQKSQEQEQSNA